MKASEKELKSCPFCGGEAVLKFEPYYSYVKCKNCAADEAAKAWNMRVGELPAADVQEIKQGRWEEEFDDITCSVCKNWFNIFDNDTQKFQYCPCCGARMDGADE